MLDTVRPTSLELLFRKHTSDNGAWADHYAKCLLDKVEKKPAASILSKNYNDK